MSNRILIEPHLTEKATEQMYEGKYSFVVNLGASKPQIRAAIERRYPGVRIKKIRTQIVPGKRRRQFRQGSMIEGRTSGFKKAIVEVDPEGEQIDFFEDV